MLILNQSQTQFDYTLPDGTTNTETRESNIVSTEVLTYSFTKVKSSNKTFLQEGDVALQTVVLTNTSLINITDILFTDALSSGATYVPNSVIVNGVAQPTYDLVAGFNVGDLAPNGVTTVSYLIQANNSDITDSEVNELMELARDSVDEGKTVNNGKGIDVGYVDSADNYQYQVIRLYE